MLLAVHSCDLICIFRAGALADGVRAECGGYISNAYTKCQRERMQRPNFVDSHTCTRPKNQLEPRLADWARYFPRCSALDAVYTIRERERDRNR